MFLIHWCLNTYSFNKYRCRRIKNPANRIKAVNGEEVSPSTMMGEDGKVVASSATKSLNSQIGKDIFGYSLRYHDADYTSANMGMLNYSQKDILNNNTNVSLYNGNISSMYTALSNTYQSTKMPQSDIQNQPIQTHQTSYQYDQLNRLLKWDGYFRNMHETQIATSGYGGEFSYDADGNLKTLEQRSLTISLDKTQFESKLMDKFEYRYIPGKNKLDHVYDDANLSANFSNDIDAGQLAKNYKYDSIGQLISDSSENIQTINWNVKNKVTEIIYTGNKAGKRITFDYDPMGRRVAKHSYLPNGLYTSTYYMLDAQGNMLSTYINSNEYNSNSSKVYCNEYSIYGSKRLGALHTDIEVTPNQLPEDPLAYDGRVLLGEDGSIIFSDSWQSVSNSKLYSQVYGNKTYELTNMLSSVLQTISDRKIPQGSSGQVISAFIPEVRTVSDYTPFGSLMESRNFSTSIHLPPLSRSNVKMGYQGSLSDDEMKGDGNSYSTFYRLLDPRLGRWFSTDPVFQPWQSPYSSMDNNPIIFNDVLGNYTKFKDEKAKKDFNTANEKVNKKINDLTSEKSKLTEKLSGTLSKRELKQTNKQIAKIDGDLENWGKLKRDFDNIIESPVEFVYSSDMSNVQEGLDGETGGYGDYLTKDAEGKITGGRVSIFVRESKDEIVVHENRHGNQRLENIDKSKLEREKEGYIHQQIYDSGSVKEFIETQQREKYRSTEEGLRPNMTLEKAIKHKYNLE